MALIKCSSCQADISPKAVSCPKCGHPNPKANHLSGASVIGILFLSAVGIWWFIGGGMNHAVNRQMGEIEAQVADDMVRQYDIAKRQGDPMQICVQASVVTAAYLQAKDEGKYRAWKKIERSACDAAGMPIHE